MESAFRTKVQKLRRIVIPKAIAQLLDIKEGDYVDVKIRKVGKANG